MKPINLSILLLTLLLLTACEQRETLSFEIGPAEMLAVIEQGDYLLSPSEYRAIADGEKTSFRLVDIRSRAAFERGSLPRAVNIPVEYLLVKENRALFADASVTHVLFGTDEGQATDPWMILRQLGFDQVKVLQGGYDYFAGRGDSTATHLAEQAHYDYAAVYEQVLERYQAELADGKPKPAPTLAPAPKQIVPKKKKKPVEEEEGC